MGQRVDPRHRPRRQQSVLLVLRLQLDPIQPLGQAHLRHRGHQGLPHHTLHGRCGWAYAPTTNIAAAEAFVGMVQNTVTKTVENSTQPAGDVTGNDIYGWNIPGYPSFQARYGSYDTAFTGAYYEGLWRVNGTAGSVLTNFERMAASNIKTTETMGAAGSALPTTGMCAAAVTPPAASFVSGCDFSGPHGRTSFESPNCAWDPSPYWQTSATVMVGNMFDAQGRPYLDNTLYRVEMTSTWYGANCAASACVIYMNMSTGDGRGVTRVRVYRRSDNALMHDQEVETDFSNL